MEAGSEIEAVPVGSRRDQDLLRGSRVVDVMLLKEQGEVNSRQNSIDLLFYRFRNLRKRDNRAVAEIVVDSSMADRDTTESENTKLKMFCLMKFCGLYLIKNCNQFFSILISCQNTSETEINIRDSVARWLIARVAKLLPQNRHFCRQVFSACQKVAISCRQCQNNGI